MQRLVIISHDSTGCLSLLCVYCVNCELCDFTEGIYNRSIYFKCGVTDFKRGPSMKKVTFSVLVFFFNLHRITD